jgi:hypothetical protein
MHNSTAAATPGHSRSGFRELEAVCAIDMTFVHSFDGRVLLRTERLQDVDARGAPPCDNPYDTASESVHHSFRFPASPLGNNRCTTLWLTIATGSLPPRSSR